MHSKATLILLIRDARKFILYATNHIEWIKLLRHGALYNREDFVGLYSNSKCFLHVNLLFL